jgi:hypothetical protein
MELLGGNIHGGDLLKKIWFTDFTFSVISILVKVLQKLVLRLVKLFQTPQHKWLGFFLCPLTNQLINRLPTPHSQFIRTEP